MSNTWPFRKMHNALLKLLNTRIEEADQAIQLMNKLSWDAEEAINSLLTQLQETPNTDESLMMGLEAMCRSADTKTLDEQYPNELEPDEIRGPLNMDETKHTLELMATLAIGYCALQRRKKMLARM